MEPELVRQAIEYPKGNEFFYVTAASRDFGLTEGTRDSREISLTDLGRKLAYAANNEEEKQSKREAFFRIPIFAQVLEHYKGFDLPDMKYLQNTLEGKFGLHPSIHQEFTDLFQRNCTYLELGGVTESPKPNGHRSPTAFESRSAAGADFVTIAEPERDEGLVCFVAMPFSEKSGEYPEGFFAEVLRQIIAPAGRNAGFKVITARKTGSDVIQATIINGLLDADLVVADLTEHNPNVLFELGVRMAEDKPVALIRAKGTKPVFDVDNILRVEDYNSCLWPSTVEIDLPKITAHIKGAWENRNSGQTYMRLLRAKAST